MNGLFLENNTLRQVGPIADLFSGAVTGQRVKLDKTDSVSTILVFGDSTVGVVDISLKQHNAISGGTSKALEVTNHYYTLVGAEATTSLAAFTKNEVTTAEDNYVLTTTYTTDPGVVVFEVKGSDLDVDNGFAWFSVDLAQSPVGNKLYAGVYVLNDMRFKPAYAVEV